MRRLILPSIAMILLATIPIAMLLFSIDPAAIAEGRKGKVVMELKNTSQDTKIARMYWVDHPWRDQKPFPRSMAVGEVKPGESFIIGESQGGYSPGIYIFTWELCHRLYPDRELGRIGKRVIIPLSVLKITVTDKLDITPKEVVVIDEFIE